VGIESSSDQAKSKTTRAVVEGEKTPIRICRHCGNEFEVAERRGGRKYCKPECSHMGKLAWNRQHRLAAQDRYCIGCGVVVAGPGHKGGRPRLRCEECSRRRLRRYEAEKKKRKNQKYQELKNVENEKKR